MKPILNYVLVTLMVMYTVSAFALAVFFPVAHSAQEELPTISGSYRPAPAQSVANAPQVNPEDAILGQYTDENRSKKMEIYKSNNKYFGKIIYDSSNKIKVGTNVLLDLVYNRSTWTGKAYLPLRNQQASAVVRLNGDAIEIEISKGIHSEKRTWTKIKP